MINLGDNTISTLYIGEAQINTIYLGEDTVYSSGPIVGIKMAKAKTFKMAGGVSLLTVNSSEAWTLSISSDVDWLSADITAGSVGKTKVTLTATENTSKEIRTATITATSTNYSATCLITQIVCAPIVLKDNLGNTNNLGHSEDNVYSFDSGVTEIDSCHYDFTGIACIIGRNETFVFGTYPAAFLSTYASGGGRVIKKFDVDISTVTNIAYIFGEQYDSVIEEVYLHNCGNLTNLRKSFLNCTNLKTVYFDNLENATKSPENEQFKDCTSLENFYVDKLPAINLDWGLDTCTALSVDSLVRILNALPEGVSDLTITLGSTNLGKLSDEQKAVATNKGWKLA